MVQASPSPTMWQDLLGTLLEERYRLDAVIAEGGMSVIFKGHHLRLNRDVALKILKPELDDGGRQFLREAENAARLNHANCITVYDFGKTSNGLNYMVMPLLQGEPLAKSVGTRMAAEEVARLGLELLRGLEHAHEQGIIHRDLKPENLFLATEPDGSRVLKIVDFGIAKLKSPDPSTMNATMSGLMSGTPTYMSPEQALGQETDERTDLYSVGVIFYTLLNGQPPFNEDDAIVVLRMHINGEIPPLPDDVPPALARIVVRLLQKERKQRYATAQEVRQDLEAALAELTEAARQAPAPAIVSPFGDTSMPSLTAASEVGFNELTDEVELGGLKRKRYYAVAVAVAVAGFGLGSWYLRGRGEPVAVQPKEPRVVVADKPSESEPHADADTGFDVEAAIAKLNEPSRARALGYEARHDLLARVEQAQASAQVDMRLQLRLDLQQYPEASDPCAALEKALTAIEAQTPTGVDTWRDSLAAVRIPSSGKGCAELEPMLERLRGESTAVERDRTARQGGPDTSDTSDETSNQRKRKRSKRRRSRKQASRSTSRERTASRRTGDELEERSTATAPPEPASTRKDPAASNENDGDGLVVPKLDDGPRRL